MQISDYNKLQYNSSSLHWGPSIDRYQGNYQLEIGSVFSFTSRDNKLFVVPVGGQPEEVSEVADSQVEWGDTTFIFAFGASCETPKAVIVRFEGIS